MPTQTFDALRRSLERGEVAPAYYFHGSEDLLKDEAVRAIVDRVLEPGLRDFNLDQRSASQAEPSEVYDLCRTPAMMADRRVVILRDVEAWKRKTKARGAALAYLGKPSADSVLVLVQGSGDPKEDRDLAKLAVSVDFKGATPREAVDWVVRRAARLEVPLAPGSADALVDAVGSDLGALATEVEKLGALGEPVAPERVAELAGVRRGETMLDWRNAILDGDRARAAGLVDRVFEQAGVSGVRLLSLLSTTLTGVGVARGAYDRNLRGQRLEQKMTDLLFSVRPGFQGLDYKEEGRRWARWAADWTPARLRAALRDALAADTALKNTTISDERGVLIDLSLRMGGDGPERS